MATRKPTTTTYVLLATALGWLALELWTITNKTPADTISENFWRWVVTEPWLTFLLGFLFGHLFWPGKATLDKAQGNTQGNVGGQEPPVVATVEEAAPAAQKGGSTVGKFWGFVKKAVKKIVDIAVFLRSTGLASQSNGPVIMGKTRTLSAVSPDATLWPDTVTRAYSALIGLKKSVIQALWFSFVAVLALATAGWIDTELTQAVSSIPLAGKALAIAIAGLSEFLRNWAKQLRVRQIAVESVKE